ncbi:hypothetical protein ACEPAG_1018 [Sanghuangporus baumii]
MDTPPYSEASIHLSPGQHSIHVNGDAQPNAVVHPNGAAPPGPNTGIGSGADSGQVDIRTLYSTSWSALDGPSPPTLREILTAYKQKGDGDREMLLAMLNAKSAEDQRIASQLSLRRTMIEINKYTFESRSPSHSQVQYPQQHTSSSSHGHHMYAYVPEEQYALAGSNHHQHHHQHHHAASVSPPAPQHAYPSGYSSSHSQATRSHAQIRAVESPPLSSATQKSVLSATRARTSSLAGSHARSSVRLTDARSQMQSVPQSQSQRRKRPRHSRSRSRSPGPIASTSPSHHRSYTYTYARSPPVYTHSVPHLHSHSEVDPEAERSSYSSASDTGSPRSVPNTYVQSQATGQGGGYPRAMAIGSLLSTGAKAGANPTSGSGSPSNSRLNGSNANGAAPNSSAYPAASGRVKEELTERDQDMDTEQEKDEAWTRERERDRKREQRTNREER